MRLGADDLRLRRAGPADAAAAERIITAVLGEYGLPFDRDGRDADVAAFGARDDHDDLVAENVRGAVFGVTSIGPHGDPKAAWLSKLFVAKEARGLGVGRALLEAAHEHARRRGYVRVGLRTRSAFEAAVKLYEANGYAADPEATDPDARIYWRNL